MGAAEFGGRHRMSRVVIVGLAWVLVTAVLSADVARAPPAAAEPASAPTGTVAVDVPASCPAGAMTLTVTGSVQPSPAPDGADVDLLLSLRLASPPPVDPSDQVWITQPLPAEIISVVAVDLRNGQGEVVGRWFAGDGWLTLVLDPAGPDQPIDEVTSVVATLRLDSGIAPAAVTVMTPDRLALGPAADGSEQPPPCTLDAPAAPVAVLEVLEPTPGGATPPPDTSPPVPVVPRDEPPDRAAGGDAPTPPPLTDEETPVVPPAPDPGAASQVVTGDTADARHRLDAALERLEASSGRVDALEGRAQRLESAERELEAERDRLATRIARVRAEMGRCAADAYEEAVDAGTDFREPGTGAALMKVLLVESVAEYERLLARQAEVLAELQIAASDRAVRQPALDDAEAERRALAAQVASRTNEMNSFLGGGEIAVSGFRFPVGAGHSFSDTWHTPRAGGRRHQGTDIFADEGTPLRAVERGALARVGSDVLGGNKLWLVGESGTHYYYAHLSDYAADMGDGMVVAAGQVIGYVGNTGDARTTPPHLHFEVHPGGGSAVNGYPMLVAADTGAPAPSDEPSAPVGRDEAAPATEAAAPDPSTATTEEAGPRRVAVGRSGQVYVADTAHDRVQRLDEDGVRLGAWGESGRADGQFRHPSGVGVGPDGSVYVADAHNNRIQRFTPTGRFIAEWGTTGDGPGQFNHPADVAVSGEGDVFVADTYNNRVQVFDADGGHLDSWGTFGADEGRLAHPAGVVVDADGEVLVADTFNGRVQRFTASGRFLAAFGSGPLVDDGPRRPGDMTVDQDGTVWVTDQVDDRVREYDGSGGLVRTWTPAELVGAEAELTPVAASLTAG